MIKDINKLSQSKISLDKTLKKFSKQKSKVVTISDLQREISNIKKDIVDLKKDLHDLKTNNKDLKQEFLLPKLRNYSDNEDNNSEHSYEGESSNNLIPDRKSVV